MRCKILFIVTFALFISSSVMGQIVFSGVVKDRNNKPISGVNVQLQNTYHGSITDSLGFFTFKAEIHSDAVLLFTHINYKPTQSVVNPVENTLLEIIMEERITVLDEVVVSSSIGYLKNKSLGISKLDTYTNPHSNGDLALALRATPGLQQIGDKEGFFVRGGNSDETVVSINGITIDNFFTSGINSISGRSRFEVGLFKGINFATGDIPVAYGNAMSGSLELTIDDIPESDLLGFGISPIYVTTNAGKLFSNKTGYIEAAVSFSNPSLYYPLFLKKNWRFHGNNNGLVGTFRLQKKFSNNSFITFLSSIGYDNKGLTLDEKEITSGSKLRDLTTFNMFNYKNYINSSSVLDFSAGYSKTIKNTSFLINDEIATSKNNGANLFQVHFAITRNLRALRLNAGVDFFNESKKFNLKHFSDMTFATYFSSTFSLKHIPFLLNLGCRSEYSSYYKKWDILPRALMSYNIDNDNSLTLGIGRYSQKENTFIIYGLTPSSKSYSVQYNLTYKFKSSHRKLLRIQAYLKKYNNLTKAKQIIDGYSITNEGTGYANGVDFFWKDAQSISGVEYSISYSYLDSKRDYLFGDFNALPTFAAKHNGSFVLKYYSPKISSQFGVALSYRSGLPFLIKERNILKQTPGMFSMDIAYNYIFSTNKMRGVISLSIPNILNNNTIIGYQLNYEGKLKNISYPTNQAIFLSFFLNFGVDRISEIVNSIL